MQLTLNFVILATALTSVAAIPLRSRDVEISARDLDLTEYDARDYTDMYLDARDVAAVSYLLRLVNYIWLTFEFNRHLPPLLRRLFLRPRLPLPCRVPLAPPWPLRARASLWSSTPFPRICST